jgi:hypothetical protein
MNERAYQSMFSVETDLIPLLSNRVRSQEYLNQGVSHLKQERMKNERFLLKDACDEYPLSLLMHLLYKMAETLLRRSGIEDYNVIIKGAIYETQYAST